jgi:uncharacterized membrane protein YkoI
MELYQNGKGKVMRTIAQGIIVTGVAFFFTVGTPSVFADNEKALPAEQVIAAIRTAVTAHPGQIKEVEVECKDDRMVVEVEIVDADGKKWEVFVDPEKNEVIR